MDARSWLPSAGAQMMWVPLRPLLWWIPLGPLPSAVIHPLETINATGGQVALLSEDDIDRDG